MAKTVQISENNIYSIFKQHKFGYLGGRDFAISDDGLNWSVINHYTDLLLTNPSTALIGDYYYIISDDSFYKTKDFNAFIKLDAQITDDKHTDLHNFEWFKDSNGSWFIKYNATSTNNAVYTYWADFDETTDSFVDAFQQFNLPNGEASGLVKVRGKYYIWQTGDKLFCADDYTGQFKEIATDIAGDTAHKQFSAVVSNNYLYVYYDADGATYERSSKATNLIHWTKPVKVVNVGLGSYFYNEKAVSVYPSFEKKASFNKILKLTANGVEQTVPINCMVPTSLQVQWEQNGSYQISFTAFDDKSVSYTMLSEEADIEFNGQHYIVKQAVEDAGGGIDTKQITATHVYNEISRVRQRNTKTGTLTYSVQDVLSFYLDDKVANPFGFTYSVYGSFDKQQIENLGNSSGSDMLSKITEQWPQAIIYPDNKNIRVYSPESFAKDYGGRIDYLHNSSDVKMTVDSTTITNQVKVFGKQIENTDDNATDNAPVKYYFDPFIVEDKDSIKQYGLHPMDDISDERFTDKNAMQTFAKGQLSPNPAVSIEVTMEDNEVPYAGEKRHLIAKPLNLETDLTVIGYTWYPFDNAQKNSLSFANLPASILKTQANINNRILMVQLIAQQAINSAKTGTRNYISRNDPMQNDSNDVHTGDIWTLPLIQETQSPMSKSINVQDESTSETNQTIYTDPDSLTKIDVQLSIWNGSRWLEISNQRTTNKLNDKIDNVANDVAEAQKGIDKAEQDAQNAVDSANEAIEQAGFANDTATTAKEVANGVKGDVADAKSDSANALQQAQDAMTNATDAKTTANSIKTDVDTVKGELTSKADKTDVDNLSGTVKTQGTAITQNAKDIESKASQSDVNTLTGRVSTAESNITQNANSIKSKVSSSDVQGLLDKGGYATQKWTGSEIDQKANEISSTVSEVSNKVDGLSYDNKNLVLNSADNSHIGITDNRYKVFKLSVDEMDSKIFTVSTYLKDIENTDGISIGLSMANANDGLRCVDADIVQIGSNSYASGVINLSGISNYKDYNYMIIYSGKGNYAGSDEKAITSYNRQVEKGAKATDWTPAPEDLATVTALSKVDQKADSISTTVTNNKKDADTKFSNINQTISGIQSTVKDKADSSTVTQLSNVVDSKVSMSDYNSEITQLANDINLRVKTDELISQINLASDNVLIQSANGKGKILLDANNVIFGENSKAFIPSAAISSLDVDKITGGITEFVKSAWNSISGSALTIDGDSLNVLSGKGGLSLDKRGINFVDINNGETIGRMSAMNWEGYPNQNGIVQELNYLGDYMGWSNQEVENGPYISKLVWYSSSLSQLLGIQQGWHMDDPVTLREVYATNDWHLNKKAIFFEDSGIRVWGDADHVYFRNKANNGNVLRLSGSDSGVQTDGTLSVSGDLGATKGKTWLKQLSVSAGIEADGLNIKNYKHAIVPTSQGVTGVNAYETAEVYFGDIGEAKTGDNSEIKIEIEKIFSETVRTDIPYHVFVLSYADANVWVTDRTQNSFIVHSSKPNVDFSWEIKAKRRGFEKDRLEIVDNVSLDYWNTYQDAKEAGASEAVLKTYTDEAKDGDVIGNG